MNPLLWRIFYSASCMVLAVLAMPETPAAETKKK